jgi:hypothetical protein
MAKQPAQIRRKLVGFDEESWHALDLLSRESMKTFRSLLTRHSATCCTNTDGRPI